MYIDASTDRSPESGGNAVVTTKEVDALIANRGFCLAKKLSRCDLEIMVNHSASCFSKFR
jgi:hypothetical protein